MYDHLSLCRYDQPGSPKGNDSELSDETGDKKGVFHLRVLMGDFAADRPLGGAGHIWGFDKAQVSCK